MMIDLIEGIEWLTQAIDGTRDIHGEYAMDVSQINSALHEISEAYENMDYVLLSDLLEYELLPVINVWRKQLAGIKEYWIMTMLKNNLELLKKDIRKYIMK